MRFRDHDAQRFTGGETRLFQLRHNMPRKGVLAELTTALRIVRNLPEQILPADAEQLRDAYLILDGIQERLPRIQCWCVAETEESMVSKVKERPLWSGHATPEAAKAWIPYWRDWCKGREWEVVRGEVKISRYYGDAVPEVRR